MRIEERNNDWVRTWAFKIDEKKAKHEGFNSEKTSGTMAPVDGYPGCPHCGSSRMFLCGACEKVSCYHGEESVTCPWCGQTFTDLQSVETIEVSGGGL